MDTVSSVHIFFFLIAGIFSKIFCSACIIKNKYHWKISEHQWHSGSQTPILNISRKTAVKYLHMSTNYKDFHLPDVQGQKHFQVRVHFTKFNLPNKTKQTIACSTRYQSKAQIHVVSIFSDDGFANAPTRPKAETHT